MKYFTFFLAAVIMPVVLAGCGSGGCISGSGQQVSQVRAVDQFSSIEVGGSVKLVIKQGPGVQLRILADDNILKGVSTSVRNNRLIIKMEDNFCETGPVTIYATSGNLDGVEASGAVEVVSEGRINSNKFNLDLSGSSKVALDISCGDMNTQTSGSSKVMLKGQAGTHNLKMSGSAELDAFDFVVGKYNINTSGASELKINALNELHVKSSGSSRITYRGNPGRVTNDNSGSSSIKRIN